jgi:hypothetical protein
MNGRRILLSLGLVAVIVGSVGCHTQAYRAHTAMNAHLYREARFEEACLPYSTKAFCTHETKLRLDAMRRHAQELAKALTLGGSAKLQLELIEEDAKGLADVK